jgi:hypothetical protein
MISDLSLALGMGVPGIGAIRNFQRQNRFYLSASTMSMLLTTCNPKTMFPIYENDEMPLLDKNKLMAGFSKVLIPCCTNLRRAACAIH